MNVISENQVVVNNEKHYFYTGIYTILKQSLTIEYKIPMSGVFSVDVSTSPVAAYIGLEDSWKKYILENYNEETPLTMDRIMIVIDRFERVN